MMKKENKPERSVKLIRVDQKPDPELARELSNAAAAEMKKYNDGVKLEEFNQDINPELAKKLATKARETLGKVKKEREEREQGKVFILTKCSHWESWPIGVYSSLEKAESQIPKDFIKEDMSKEYIHGLKNLTYWSKKENKEQEMPDEAYIISYCIIDGHAKK